MGLVPVSSVGLRPVATGPPRSLCSKGQGSYCEQNRLLQRGVDAAGCASMG